MDESLSLGIIILGMADLVLCSGTITLKWGGSDNMKLGFVAVAVVPIWDFIFVLMGLDLVLYIVGYSHILYVTLSRLICPVFSV